MATTHGEGSASTPEGACEAHGTYTFGTITFCSDFDNGNLRRVVPVSSGSGAGQPLCFNIWTAPDNAGSEVESNHCSWYYFSVTGLAKNANLRIRLMNTKKHAGLYRSDMRPVFKSNATQGRWLRIRKSIRVDTDGFYGFEHVVDSDNDVLWFAFTYPYSYSTLQSELDALDQRFNTATDGAAAAPKDNSSIYYRRELLTRSIDGRRIDLLTITSSSAGMDTGASEPLLPGLHPPHPGTYTAPSRPCVFPKKDVVVISARVHPGEVPAQHTLRGIIDLLLDPNDPRARALRDQFVFKIVPMLNPDGVFRGHFRMDQLGQNLNRFYTDPDPQKQPSIFALKSIIDYYAAEGKLAMYLDLHAHASKRGCFIYGNVVDSFNDQVQNQLFCRLIALNTPHFDYEGCLFSKDHMTRIDPGDGMTAEGSSRVYSYLAHKLIHSYTLECNYNMGRICNEVALPEGDLGESCTHMAYRSWSATSPLEKYSPASYENVGQACVLALLDIRGQNPCPRIGRSRWRTLDRLRQAAVADVRALSEYREYKPPTGPRKVDSAQVILTNNSVRNVCIPDDSITAFAASRSDSCKILAPKPPTVDSGAGSCSSAPSNNLTDGAGSVHSEPQWSSTQQIAPGGRRFKKQTGIPLPPSSIPQKTIELDSSINNGPSAARRPPGIVLHSESFNGASTGASSNATSANKPAASRHVIDLLDGEPLPLSARSETPTTAANGGGSGANHSGALRGSSKIPSSMSKTRQGHREILKLLKHRSVDDCEGLSDLSIDATSRPRPPQESESSVDASTGIVVPNPPVTAAEHAVYPHRPGRRELISQSPTTGAPTAATVAVNTPSV